MQDPSAQAPDDLLRENETEVPPAVQRTFAFLARHGMWHVLSRNPTVRSCRDAARNRYRLGTVGIPLEDELKSYLAHARLAGTGEPRTVLFHCRGDQVLALGDKIREIFGFSSVERMALEESNALEFDYGLVTPFREGLAVDGHPLLQVFDRSLLAASKPPGTVMTNAGDRTWAIEFRPAELIKALPPDQVMVADIAETEAARPDEAPDAVGIITGNTPESGMILWSKINQAFVHRLGPAFLGDISYPRVIVHSVPEMGLSMELRYREQDLWQILQHHLENLTAIGVRTVAFACHTTQYYEPRLNAFLGPRGAKFLGMADILLRWLRRRQADQELGRVSLVGIDPPAAMEDWSAYRSIREELGIQPLDEASFERIRRLAYDVKTIGVSGVTYQRFRRLLRSLPSGTVILLLTELSMIFHRYPRKAYYGLEIIDALDLYAEAIVDEILH